MGKQVNQLIELVTGFIIVFYVWSPFITFSKEIIDFWDLSIGGMVWYLLRLAFTVYATWLIITLFADHDEEISANIKRRKDRGL